MTLLLKEMQRYYVQSIASAKQGLAHDGVEARCYLLFKNEVHCEVSDGELLLFCSEKDKTFILEVLYGQFKSEFLTLPIRADMPEDMKGMNLNKQKMRVNTLSDSQDDYDFANTQLAEKTVDDFHFLSLPVMSDILAQLDRDVLLSEDMNLLNNI